MTKVSKHMSDLIPTLAGLKGKYWGYYPSKVETANSRHHDWHHEASRCLYEIGYEFDHETEPKELFDHMVRKMYFSREDATDGKSVVELTKYEDNGYTWAHVCVSGDAIHGMEVWEALYGEEVYDNNKGEY